MAVLDRDSRGRFLEHPDITSDFAVVGDIRVRLRPWVRVNQHAARVTQNFTRHMRLLGAVHPNLEVTILIDKAHVPWRQLAEISDELAPFVLKHAGGVLREAIQITPVDTGTLVSTGKVSRFITRDTDIVASVSFDTDYAAAVHEILENQHAPPTRAKFLEIPLRRSKASFVKGLRVQVRKAIAKRAI